MKRGYIITKLVLFTIAIGGNTFSEPTVNIVSLYKLPLRVVMINIFDGKIETRNKWYLYKYKVKLRGEK